MFNRSEPPMEAFNKKPDFMDLDAPRVSCDWPAPRAVSAAEVAVSVAAAVLAVASTVATSIARREPRAPSEAIRVPGPMGADCNAARARDYLQSALSALYCFVSHSRGAGNGLAVFEASHLPVGGETLGFTLLLSLLSLPLAPLARGNSLPSQGVLRLRVTAPSAGRPPIEVTTKPSSGGC